jgi:hypothetical protein
LEKCAAKKQEITTTSLGEADTSGLRYKPDVFKMPPGLIKFNPQERPPSITTLDYELTLNDCRFLARNPKLTTAETLEIILDALDKAIWSLHLSESEISSKFSTIFDCMNKDRKFDRKLVLKVFDEVSDNYVNNAYFSAIWRLGGGRKGH